MREGEKKRRVREKGCGKNDGDRWRREWQREW